MIQVQADNLPTAQLGDSTQLQVGDWVVAIGNALALPGGPTVTQGVVSALGRTVQEPGKLTLQRKLRVAGGRAASVGRVVLVANRRLLVHSCSTSFRPMRLSTQANSGGPLVNLQGQVIGINTLVAGQAEPGVQAQDIGFAISIATARPIADQLTQNGRVVHPFIGIQYAPLTPAIAAQLGAQVQDGAVIGQVVPGSPAARPCKRGTSSPPSRASHCRVNPHSRKPSTATKRATRSPSPCCAVNNKQAPRSSSGPCPRPRIRLDCPYR